MAFTRASIQRLERDTARFLQESETAASMALEAGAVAAKKTVQLDPQFKPKTGNLQRRTKTKVVRTRGGFLMRLTNDAPYAASIDKGARPHVIRPKRSKFLTFKIGDRWVRAKSVNHPGNRAFRFLSRAHESAGSVTERVLRARLSQIATRF